MHSTFSRVLWLATLTSGVLTELNRAVLSFGVSYLQERHNGMLRNFRNSFISMVLLAVFVLTGTGGALAAVSPTYVPRLSVGSRVCTNDLYAYSKVRIEGQANYPGVRFTLLRSLDGVNFNPFLQSPTDTTTAYAAQANSYGWFRACARNLGTTGVTNVNVTLKTDVDVP